MQPIEEQGYVILAVNSADRDYISCAKTLARSLKHWNPKASVCLITDSIDHHDSSVFDHCQVMAVTESNPYANDWKVFELSPYRETIKLEADMLIVSSIDHWWNMCRHRDVVVSTGCRNFYDRVSDNRYYRHFIDQNHLPDVYNAVTYWRRSQTAHQFFELVKQIFQNWPSFKKLVKFPEDQPSTDFVYAMAAEIMGPENVTLPFASYPRIIHMKQRHINTKTEQWPEELVWELDHGHLRINTVAQWGAFHYGSSWNIN